MKTVIFGVLLDVTPAQDTIFRRAPDAVNMALCCALRFNAYGRGS